MAPPCSTAAYPLSWAIGIVKTLERKHPRGWELFKQNTGLSEKQVAKLLASRRQEYQICREIIKKGEILDERVRLGYAEGCTYRNLLLGKAIKMPTKMRDYLTAYQDSIQ